MRRSLHVRTMAALPSSSMLDPPEEYVNLMAEGVPPYDQLLEDA